MPMDVVVWSSWLWVVFFVAAYVLLIRRTGHWALILGLAGLGVVNLAYQLPNWDAEFGEVLLEFGDGLPVLAGISALLLAFGAVAAAGRSGGAAPAAAGGPEQNLTTLLVPRSGSNTYTRAEALRDEAAQRLIASAQAAGIRTIEQKSNAHSAEVWLELHYLLPKPDPALALRASVALTVRRFDFHRFEHLFDVTARLGATERRIDGVIAIDDDATARLQRFLTVPGTRLKLPNRVRTWPWELWRPRNKVARIRADWRRIGLGALAVLLFFVPIVGPLAAAAVFIWLALDARKRPVHTLTEGKPAADPRDLRWMDSWQATVAGLGELRDRMREGIVNRLRRGAPSELGLGTERFAYWSVDGQVQRDQLAVRYRRALGFVHVVPYGDHLYVGWECHLNAAAWAEETIARGVDRVSGCNVHANRVVYGTQALNEYDLADANFLSEWLHEAVKSELRLQAAERQIDLELDFTVQRESRKSALGSPAAAKPEARSLLGGRFKRVK
jgi:hypothetical protein